MVYIGETFKSNSDCKEGNNKPFDPRCTSSDVEGPENNVRSSINKFSQKLPDTQNTVRDHRLYYWQPRLIDMTVYRAR